MDLFTINSHRAIVTRGTRGLGFGAAEALLEAGASVIIFGSNDGVNQAAISFQQKDAAVMASKLM